MGDPRPEAAARSTEIFISAICDWAGLKGFRKLKWGIEMGKLVPNREKKSEGTDLFLEIWQSVKPSKCKAVEVQICRSADLAKCEAVEVRSCKSANLAK
jgi:hypothetical protein